MHRLRYVARSRGRLATHFSSASEEHRNLRALPIPPPAVHHLLAESPGEAIRSSSIVAIRLDA